MLGRIALTLAAIIAASSAARALDCDRFRAAMAQAAGELKVDFVRPLVVSRGGGSGLEQFDLVSRAKIDAVLKCRGEAFVSLEAKIHMPVDALLAENFAAVEAAAISGALGWSQQRAHAKVNALSADAAEYLRGSEERGDVAVAGKIEDHLPGDFDVGAIWTRTERTFVLVHGG